jgi:hypothetical protein
MILGLIVGFTCIAIVVFFPLLNIALKFVYFIFLLGYRLLEGNNVSATLDNCCPQWR